MHFEESELREFIQLWTEEFHETISMEDAKVCAAMLLSLFRLLLSADSNNPESNEIFSLLP
jgi:hypothetical protein